MYDNHIYVKSKKKKKIHTKQRVKWQLPRDEKCGMKQMFKGTNWQNTVKTQKCTAQYSEYKQHFIIIIKLAKKLELNYYNH